MAEGKRLHVALFPWLAFGHIHPFLQLAKFIAEKGHKISFISTPRNIDRLPKLPPHLASSISLVKIPLPRIPELPENAEATLDIPNEDVQYLKKAFDGLETGLARFLEESIPDLIIYDFAPHWLPPIAARLGVSRVHFGVINAWFLAFFGSPDGSDERKRAEDFMVPPKWVPFETKVAYKRYEAEWVVSSIQESGNASGFSDGYRGIMAISGAEAIVLRHCNEFEPQWLKLAEELQRKPVIPVGLLPPQVQDNNGDQSSEAWHAIKNWLEGHAKGSVVYVALGTEVTPSQDQLNELALGLELSGLPFFWALRDNLKPSVLKLPDGFEERVKQRAMVWKSWAPQLQILHHEAVGGFLTHCGWNSIIEGIAFGRPLIALPFLVDQGLNARVIGEKELGVEIPRNELVGSFTRNSVADSVKLVMSEEDGKIYKTKAGDLGAIIGNKELHQQYMNNFVEFLEIHRSL